MIDSLNYKLSDIKRDANALARNQDLPESCHREIVLFNEKIDFSVDANSFSSFLSAN